MGLIYAVGPAQARTRLRREVAEDGGSRSLLRRLKGFLGLVLFGL